MINIVTLFDSKYIAKGMAMIESVKSFLPDANVFVLALDNITENALPKYDWLTTYSIKHFNNYLKYLTKNESSQFGTKQENIYWGLTPVFTNYISNMHEGNYTMYVDADIYFYHSPELIITAIGDKSVGIHSHRFTGSYRDVTTGWYNVGVVCFKNDDVGKEILSYWSNWLLNRDNEFYLHYGTCGDQKYLDLFPKLWPDKICIFDEQGISHIAPWNADVLEYLHDNKVIYKGNEEPLVFGHFSHFNYKQDSWRDSNGGEWNPSKDIKVKEYYEQYHNKLKSIHDRHNWPYKG